MTWKEFFQHNIDKILLIIVMHGMIALLITQLSNAIMVDWLKGEIGTVMGALLMLITGRALRPDPAAVKTVTTSTSTQETPKPVASQAVPAQE